MRSISTLFLLIFFGNYLSAQSTAYIINAGPTLGIQKWDNGGERQVLFKYHVALAIESVNNDDDKSAGFIQLGYHVKGSAERFPYSNVFTGSNSKFSKEYLFNNLSLAIGAKQKFPIGTTGQLRYFYYGAIRGDYTLNIKIRNGNDEYGTIYSIYDPQDAYVKHFIFGLSIGGGLQFPLSNLVGGQITLSICPDITNQYRQPAIPNVIIPYVGIRDIPERRIRNTAVEISVGLRLLHKVEIVE